MSTSGNYLNADNRGNIQQPSAFAVLSDIMFQRSEERRQQALKVAEEERVLNRNKRLAELSAIAINNKNGIKTELGKADTVTERSGTGASLMKIAPISKEMQSFQSNTSPYQKSAGLGNMLYNADMPDSGITMQAPQMASLFQTAQQQAPQEQQDMAKVVFNPSKNSYDVIDPNEDIGKIQEDVAKVGIDPYNPDGTPKSKRTLIQSMAKKKAQVQTQEIPAGFEIVGYDQEGRPMVRKDKSLSNPTQGQETTALYASRIKQANDVFDKLETFANNQNFGDMVQAGLPNFANVLKSEDMQSMQQAQKNFLNAVLRRESGAVISPSEFANGREQYFPQPGDKPDVLAQKKSNRDLVMKNFITSARGAYVPYEETNSGVQTFNVNGKTYNIPADKVDEFKKDMGL